MINKCLILTATMFLVAPLWAQNHALQIRALKGPLAGAHQGGIYNNAANTLAQFQRAVKRTFQPGR